MKQTEALFALAHIGPATVQEVEDWWREVQDKDFNAQSALVRLMRDGMVMRRRRESDGLGRPPYEYTIHPVDER